MKTIDKIIEKVNCKYGAPMGRYNVDDKPSKNGLVLDEYMNNPKNRFYDSIIPLNSGYDKGGAYWGIGGTLHVKYTKDLLYIEFYRK